MNSAIYDPVLLVLSLGSITLSLLSIWILIFHSEVKPGQARTLLIINLAAILIMRVAAIFIGVVLVRSVPFG